jgi:large subunit ribosomal protein L20
VTERTASEHFAHSGINAAAREAGISYSVFINKLKKANVTLDRKVLSEIATNHPATFKKIVDTVNK